VNYKSKFIFKIGDLVTGQNWSVYFGDIYMIISISIDTFNDYGDPLIMILNPITNKLSPAWPISLIPI
jgi:hypothetical protein